MSFTIYPAIDVRGGRVVRLHQGDYAKETRYDDDPLERALSYAEAGARWLHLVDLDAAREGRHGLHRLAGELAGDGRLRVQSGGGVRSADDVQALLDAGVSRVVVGSMAATQPREVAGWLERFGSERLAVALDVRQDKAGRWWPATHGWTRTAESPLDELLALHAAAGLRHLLCTDISRDGTMAGPNLALYRGLAASNPQLSLQASGGARSLQDVTGAWAAGCGGIVLGKALLEGHVDLREAMAVQGLAAGDGDRVAGVSRAQ